MTLTWRALAHSEVGLVRKDNQDSGYISDTMLLVADGMGGAAAGDLASAVAATEFARIDTEPGPDPLTKLEAAVERADGLLAKIVEQDPSCDGMGTTLCGGILSGDDLTVVHIGDSRGYLYRAGRLRRLTHDHSYVQSLIDQGKLTESGALTHPHRSLLLRVLNGQRYTAPEYFSQTLQDKDRLMFCSDGLCGLVADDAIAALIAVDDPVQAMEQLVAAAHLASGSDNITIIIADVAAAASQPGGGADDRSLSPTQPIGTGGGFDKRSLSPAQVVEPAETSTRRRSPNVRAGDQKPADGDDGQAPLPIDSFITVGAGGGLFGAAADPAIVKRIPKTTRPPLGGKAAGTTRADRRQRRRLGPAKKRHRGLIVLIALLVVLIGGAGWGAYAYGASQYFIAPDHGTVAIYQGVPGSILGLETNRVYQRTDIPLANLPYSYRDRVTTGIPITSGGIGQARATVAELRAKADQCLSQRLHNGGITGADGC